MNFYHDISVLTLSAVSHVEVQRETQRLEYVEFALLGFDRVAAYHLHISKAVRTIL